MDWLVHDARVALRGLQRSPTFAVTAVVILAVAMAMAGAMYSIVDSVLLRPLPVRDQDRIVMLNARDRNGVDVSLAGQDFADLRRDTRLVQNMAGIYHAGPFVQPLDLDGRPIELNGAIVTGNFFEMLGVRPVLGRLLRPVDDSVRGVEAVVLSYSAWRRQFGGDPGVLGKHLRSPYDLPPYTYDFRIIGVAPPGLDFPAGVEMWRDVGYPSYWNLDAVGRLAPGASATAAGEEFLAVMRRLGRRETSEIDVATADIRTLPAAVSGDFRPTLIVIAAAVVFLIVIGYVNVSNLLLVRGARRSPELIIRRAIGGTRGDIVRLLSLESTALVIIGVLLAIGIAQAFRGALLDLAPRELPRTDVIRLAGAPVTVIACAAVVAAFTFGGVSWFIATRWAASARVSADGRSATRSRQRRRLGQTLVGAQVALALVMLIGAGLLIRTLMQLERLQLGYSPDQLSILTVAFPMTTKYDSLRKSIPLVEAFSPRVRAIPGVIGLTPVIAPAFAGAQVWTMPWEAEGEAPEPGTQGPDIPIEAGGSEFFNTLEIPIIKGRGFLPSDRADAPLVAVVSVAVARRFWQSEDPIGKRIRGGTTGPWRTVVGIAGDTHFRALQTATPTIYLPWRQFYWQGFLAIRTRVPLRAVVPGIRQALAAVDPTVTLWRTQTLDESIDEQLAQPRLSTVLMSGFGVVALLLTAVGLYGVMASTVREETHDIGVRMALGATAQQLRRDVLRRALIVVVAGAIVGLGVALIATRLVRSLLFDISPADPAALGGASGLLLGVSLIAAYLPARYASRIDPARALQVD